jgi:hypothetical protein
MLFINDVIMLSVWPYWPPPVNYYRPVYAG